MSFSNPPKNSISRRLLLIRSTFGALGILLYGKAIAIPSSFLGSKKKIVVIGSGIGGMASAALFAKEGHEVTVLERNELIGGHARHLEREGMLFCMGPQYVWDFNEGAIGDRFLKHLGLDQSVSFTSMDAEAFETVFLQQSDLTSKRYEVPIGLSKFRDYLSREFPQESKNISNYFNDMIAITEGFQAFSDQFGLKGFWKTYINLIVHMRLPLATKLKIIKAASSTLSDWFDQYHLSDGVRRVIYGHGGIYAENESEVSTLIYMIGTGYYHKGTHYPELGFSHLFFELKRVIEENGGQVLTQKSVVQLNLRNGSIVSALCEDGSSYICDQVFSNVSPRLTEVMIPSEYKASYSYEPSHGIAVCMITLNAGYEGLEQIRGKNFWWQDGKGEVEYNHVSLENSPRMLYITSHTVNGFGRVDSSDQRHSLTVFVPTDFYKESAMHQENAAGYESYKERVLSDVVKIIDEQIFPGISAFVQRSEAVTTVELVRDTGAERGNVYGKRLSVAEYKRGRLASPKVSNLRYIQATSGGPGIARGVLNAANLLEELTGRKI